MKKSKILMYIFLLLFISSGAGCDNNKDSTNPTQSVESSTVSEEITEVLTEPVSYEIKTKSSIKDGGITTGDGIYQEGEFATIEAMTSENYQFVSWSINDEVVSTDPIYKFLVKENQQLTARFEIAKLMSDQLYESVSNEIANYEININVIDETNADLLLKNKTTDETKKLFTLTDCVSGHYHFIESHNGNVYLIRRIGNTDTEHWTDELWRYSLDNTVTKLYTMQGLDFRVSPNEAFIAAQEYTNRLTILDADGQILKNYTNEDLTDVEFNESTFTELLKWSDDSSTMWGCLSTPIPLYLFEIQTSNWEVRGYDFAELSVGDEHDLNPNSQLYVFSNLPMILDAYSWDELITSKKELNLYLYNLETKELQILDTSVAKAFKPVWIGLDTIEYDDPESDNRIKFTVNYH